MKSGPAYASAISAVIALLLFATPIAAQAPAPADKLAALRAELEAMHETDQAQRKLMTSVEKEHGPNAPQLAELWRKQGESDRHNIKRLEEILAEHGWPKRSQVGNRAASAAFLILQHSDLSYQRKYVQLIRDAVTAGEMNGSSLALLEDRILLREGKKQIYGSQVSRNDAGDWEPLPLEEEDNVDQRRASVGLPPLAEYLRGFAERSGGGVADRTNHRPSASAPSLTQTLFAADDDARTVHGKLAAFRPQRGEPALQFQLACRDFCARFPASPFYGAVMVLAARSWVWLSEAQRAQLEGWSPADPVHEPKLNPEQRARVALTMATALHVAPAMLTSASYAESRFDAIVGAIGPHRASHFARSELVGAALEAPPEKALPTLRELYPDDAAVAACIQALESMGKPLEVRLAALDGKPLDLRDFRGKVVLVQLFLAASSSGGVSQAVVSDLKKLAERFGADLAIVGVSVDRDRAAVERFVDHHAIAWPVHHDGFGWQTPLMQRHLIKAVPYHLLVDRQGRLRFRGGGPTGTVAPSRIELLLAERDPPGAP